MPPRTPKACRVRGCRSTTIDPSGYCESHKGEGWKSYKPGQSRHQRGYGTKWEVIRARILKRDKGLCQEHLRQGTAKQASCVDHVKAKAHGGTDDDSNLESLCWSCHAAKTARERLKLDSISSSSRGGGGQISATARLPDCPPPRIFLPAKNQI